MILIHRRIHIPRDAAVAGWERDWRALEEVCIGLFDCPHSTPKLALSGPYVVRSQDIRSGVFRLEEAAHVSRETYQQRIARAEPRYGDLIYSREGTYFGIAAEVPNDVEVCLGQRMVLVRPDPQLIDHQYLLYWLNSPVMARHIHGHRDGSVAERLNMPTIRGLPVPLLPILEQRAIASVLSALDYKIELNRRMNETLEALARALFKSWFVDFGPVRAKAEGRKPFGMDDATAAVFPDRFGPDGLPEGWREATISRIAEVNAWTLRSSDELDEIQYVEISSVDRGQIKETACYQRGEEPSRARRRLRHGDTALSTVRPERRAYFLALNPSPNLVASTGFAVVTPKAAPWSFVHAALTMPEVFEELGHLADGAAYPAVRPDAVESISIARPSDPRIFKAYHALVAPLLELAHSNRQANDTLADLRDLLLPKLMSGEIRVAHSENSADGAG